MGRQNSAIVAESKSVTAYSGPIPPPESLEKYEQVVPGSAERILAMAEKEQEHRHKTEDKQTSDYKSLIILSTIFTSFVALAFVGAIIYAIYKKVDGYAIALMIASVGCVVGYISIKRKNN